jgi:hypothetical protein
VSARRLSFRVIEGGGKPTPPADPFTPAHGLAIAFVASGIFWLGIGAAVLAWWERP